MNEAVRVFKALADPTRLRIIKLLEGGELCVCQLTAALGMGQSRISRHLSILKQAGIISDRRQGKWVHYQLCCADPADKISGIYNKLSHGPIVNRDRSAIKICRQIGPGKRAADCRPVNNK